MPPYPNPSTVSNGPTEPKAPAAAPGPRSERFSLAPLARPFRHRNFRLFFGGQFISLLGTWMQSVALSWLVYRLTGSSASLGLVGFAGQIPVFVFALFGGAVADRVNKRRILLATQTVSLLQALALALLAFSGRAEVWQLAALALLLGLVTAMDHPTRLSFLVELVGKEDLHTAIGLNSSMFHCARMLGPALAGGLLAMVGEGWCFLLNATSYVAVIGALLALRVAPEHKPAKGGEFFKSIAEGVRFAWRAREIRALLALTAVCGLLGMSYSTLMPVFAAKVYGCGPRGYGLLMASGGAGSMAGALVLAMRPGSEGLWRWRYWSGLGFGASLCAFAAAPVVWVAAALVCLVGFFMLLLAASTNTLLQLGAPDALRGRVMSLFSMLFLGMAPFGALVSGLLAERAGAPLTVGLSGGLCLMAAFFFGRRPKRDAGPE